MNKKLKGLISLLLCMMLVISSASAVFAAKSNSGPKDLKSINSLFNSKGFKDVKENHWAYKYINWMLDNKIIDGVGNNMFDPKGTVTRAQFAKMMVNTLNLQLISPETPTFSDVKKNSWEYQYVESAKNYLTRYKQSNTFKPSENAVREDMAVALVKALNYDAEDADLSLLNKFADANSISPALRSYVALAVEYELITGYTDKGKLVFGPLANLNRAEAAALLYRAFKVNEDKVPYEDDKVPYEDDDEDIDEKYVKPVVSVVNENNTTVVRWNRITSSKLQGYKVVISRYDSTPSYPDNGYLYFITDLSKDYALINNSAVYNNGDFGKYLTKGEKYYFSVTAVYKDKNVAGNTVRFEYNGAENPEEYVKPGVTAAIENGKLVLRWNKIENAKLKNYRVVASKGDSTPSYPDDGYLVSISDSNRNYAVIDNTTAYTNGDFGNYFTKGERYYFSVTAVYDDKNVAGNAVRIRYNGVENPEAYVVPVVTAAEENGKLVLRWNKIDSAKLKNYRVVASKGDSTPSYPDDGYLFSISDSNKNYAVIDNTTAYTKGDFGGYFVKGEKYYFNITAVYEDRVIAGNTIQVQYNGDDSAVVFPVPKVTAAYEGGKLLVKWDKIDSAKLVEYRVVISQNNQAPIYPANGYYDAALGKDVTSVEIDGIKTYTGGDFTALTYGTEYNFSVTAVYDNGKYVAGNAVKVLYLINAGV